MQCRCKTLKFRIDKHPSKPYPAGVVSVSCEGLPLPVTIAADDVAAPPCAP